MKTRDKNVNPIFGDIDFLLMVDRLSESALRPVLCFGLLPDYRLCEPPMVIILEIHQKPVRSLPLALTVTSLLLLTPP